MSGQLSKGGKLDTFGHMREGVGCLSSTVSTRSTAQRAWPVTPYSAISVSVRRLRQRTRRTLNHLLVRLNPALHRQEMARAPLPVSELCTVCHAQFMETIMNNWG